MLGLAQTLPDLLREAAERFGDHPAYVEGDRSLSYAQLLPRVEATAAAYAAAGVGPGDRVVAVGAEQHRLGRGRAGRVVRRRRAGAGELPLRGPEVVDDRGADASRPGRGARRVPGPRPARTSSPRPACPRRWSHWPGPPVRSTVPQIRHRVRNSWDCDHGGPTRARPRRRRRHPVHLRHHRPLQGRDERAPADDRRRAGLGRARRGARRTTATWWSTRSSTPSATRSASSSGCSPAARSTRWRPSTSRRRCG